MEVKIHRYVLICELFLSYFFVQPYISVVVAAQGLPREVVHDYIVPWHWPMTLVLLVKGWVGIGREPGSSPSGDKE